MPLTANSSSSGAEKSQVTGVQDAITDPIDELYALLRSFASSNGFSELKAMRGENVMLHEKLQTVEVAYNQNLDALTQIKSQMNAEKEQIKKITADRKSIEIQLDGERSKATEKANVVKQQEQRLQNLILELKLGTLESRVWRTFKQKEIKSKTS
ncbi:hypothetical protein QQS21_010753 [Conoideocrella luteorostrata]|uniref:Uncharacterized protein n=1 Tax=Conoideocrella luteorostrata TaxID=1105319 RepID=A0AAJ0CEE6_9HYPO|nr:hypothetical protein QQS21_010753 [Conoideocrella luteorostrata]